MPESPPNSPTGATAPDSVASPEPLPIVPSEPEPYYGVNSFNPAYLLQKEEPQHRMICILAAQGFTTTEIAEQTGYTTATVAYVKKQPFALKYLAQMQHESRKQAVDNVLSGAALDAARLLVDTIRDAQERKDIRVKEANNLLNRLYGNAPTVHVHKSDPSELTDAELIAIIKGNAA